MRTLSADEREARAAVKIARALRGASAKYSNDRWKRALLHGLWMHGQLNHTERVILRDNVLHIP